MKRISKLFLGLGCIAALTLTSCIDTDNNNNNQGLSKAEISQCFNTVRGDYTGKMLYLAKNAQDITDTQDTVDISWTITADTMLVVKSFPAKAVAESVWNKELKAALIEQNPVADIECLMAFMQNDPYIEFALGPQMIEYPIFYKEATHTLSVYFWSNYYSFGDKSADSDKMVVRITMGAAYLDGNELSNLINSGGGSDITTVQFILTNSLD